MKRGPCRLVGLPLGFSSVPAISCLVGGSETSTLFMILSFLLNEEGRIYSGVLSEDLNELMCAKAQPCVPGTVSHEQHAPLPAALRRWTVTSESAGAGSRHPQQLRQVPTIEAACASTF